MVMDFLPLRCLLFGLFCAFSFSSLAQTVAYWRMDAGADGQPDGSNAIRNEYALTPSGAGVSVSYRIPLRTLPAISLLPSTSKVQPRNLDSFFCSGIHDGRLFATGLERYLSLTNSFTLEGWFRPVGNQRGDVALFSVGNAENSWQFLQENSVAGCRYVLSFVQNGKTVHRYEMSDLFFFREGEWQFFALTYAANAHKWEMTLGGRQWSRLFSPPPQWHLPKKVDLILAGTSKGDMPFCGELDLWRLSDRVMPAEAFLSASRVSTVAFWPLDANGLSTNGWTDCATARIYPLRPGRDSGVTLIKDSSSISIPNPDDFFLNSRQISSDSRKDPQRMKGCARFRGGIGVRSHLRAEELGSVCEWTRGFTVEGWFRKAGEPDARHHWMVVGTRDDASGWALNLAQTPEGRTTFSLFVSDVVNGGALQFDRFFHQTDLTGDKEWHHVALVCDALVSGRGSWSLYLDGVLQGEMLNPVKPDRSHGVSDFFLGGSPSYSHSFVGDLCGWRVSDGPLPVDALLCVEQDKPRDPPSAFFMPDARNVDSAPLFLPADESREAVSVLPTANNGILLATTEQFGQEKHASLLVRNMQKDLKPHPFVVERGWTEISRPVLFRTPYGRIYLFYTLNGDRIFSCPGQTQPLETIPPAWLMYRFSDDEGASWSTNSFRIPLRVTTFDRLNPWGGKYQRVCNGISAVQYKDTFLLPFTKMGTWPANESEGWILRSENLLTERNPGLVRFHQFPEGDCGIRFSQMETEQTDHRLDLVSSDRLFFSAAGERGSAYCESPDGGKSWSSQKQFRFSLHGKKIRNGGRLPLHFSTPKGSDVLLFSGTEARKNPGIYFCSTGVNQTDAKYVWSQPELALYSLDPMKSVQQLMRCTVGNSSRWMGLNAMGEVFCLTDDKTVAEEKPLSLRKSIPSAFGSLRHGGFSVVLEAAFSELPEWLTFFSTLDPVRGVSISRVPSRRTNPQLRIDLYDGDLRASWTTDAAALPAKGVGRIAFSCDFRARLLTVIADGSFCDGGNRHQGWLRLPVGMGSVAGAHPKINPLVRNFELFDRPISTAEAVSMTRK